MIVDRYPLPNDEKERLNALHSYDILDTLPEEQYDAIVRLASYICDVPLAFISFIDEDRQWFKARKGMDIDSLPRTDAFCRYAILQDQLTVVPDTTQNQLYADSPYVQGGAQIRFYASAPIIDPDGYRVGSLCVFDTKPKELNEQQRDALQTLAADVISHLVLRKQQKELEENLQWHKEFYNLFNTSSEIHCITDNDLNILLINQSVKNILGYNAYDAIGTPIWKYFPDNKRAEMLKMLKSNAEKHIKSFEIETPIVSTGGDVKWISWCGKAEDDKWYASGRDITSHKQVSEELKLLSLVASKVNNGIVISNANDDIVWTNKGFEQITGYQLGDVQNMNLRSLLEGTIIKDIATVELDERIRNKQSYEVDVLIKRKDGTKVWVSIINSIIRDENGNVDKQIRIIIDISERKRVEQDLEILSSATRKSPTGILIRDPESRIIWMNEAFEKVSGYSLEEMKGKDFGEELVGPETDAEVFKRAKNLLKENKPYEVEVQLYRKDKSYVWVFLSTTPYYNTAGELERHITVAVDISERKAVEQQLKLLSMVASNTLSGVVINDNEGRVEWVNSAFEKMTGYSVADVKSRHLGDVLRGELTDVSIIEKVRELSRNKQSFDIDLLAYRKDGQPLWVSVINSVVLDAKGQVDKYIEFIIDITPKKKAELELIQAKEEALQLSRAKDMFISVMSHEIRTPLNAVIGMSHLLLEDNPTESQMENLSVLRFSAENLLTLINDVLDFAKIETGNIDLERTKTDLREIVSGVIASMQYKTGSKDIYVKSSVEESVPQLVLGDRTRLTQILLNLLANAVKFTDEGGVTLDLKVIEQNPKEVRIRFAVSDTGIGIAANKLNTIFESFKQAELDTTRKYGGTGLGLAITKRLVELHDSRINVDSVLGQGSTFWFTITFVIAEDNTVTNKTQVESGLNLNALVVDDNQINRLLINKVLKKWGATADFAENGVEAIEKVEKNRSYDVVLMDIHMPVMGGLEASKLIRQKEGSYFKHLPIVALTASMLNNQMSQIEEAGMNDYVLKPFDPKALFEKLSKFQRQ